MASNYSRFSKGIDDAFKDINRDNKIKKVVEARDSIQLTVKKSLKVTLDNIKSEIKSSDYSDDLNIHFNTIDNNLYVLVDNVIEYTDDFVRYIKKENNPTVFSLVIYGFGGFVTFLFCIWFVLNSPSILQFFIRVFVSIIISLLSLVVGYRIDIAGRHWLLTDSIHRSKTKCLEALEKIQKASSFIIEELKLLSIDTKSLTNNISYLSTASEEFFKV